MDDTPKNKPSAANGERESAQNSDGVVRPPTAAIPEIKLTNADHNNAQKKERWTNDRAMFWVTLAGVIAVLVYTSVAAWQACLTQAQLTVMQEQLDEMKQSFAVDRAYVL